VSLLSAIARQAEKSASKCCGLFHGRSKVQVESCYALVSLKRKRKGPLHAEVSEKFSRVCAATLLLHDLCDAARYCAAWQCQGRDQPVVERRPVPDQYNEPEIRYEGCKKTTTPDHHTHYAALLKAGDIARVLAVWDGNAKATRDTLILAAAVLTKSGAKLRKGFEASTLDVATLAEAEAFCESFAEAIVCFKSTADGTACSARTAVTTCA
jgi:hypothetical protein